MKLFASAGKAAVTVAVSAIGTSVGTLLYRVGENIYDTYSAYIHEKKQRGLEVSTDE